MSICRPMRRAGLVAALALPFVSSGCAELFGPGSIAGVYVLETFDGREPPVDFWSTDVGRLTVLADTLVLRDSRSGTWARSVEQAYFEPAPVVERLHLSGIVVITEMALGELRLQEQFECGPFANCVFPPAMPLAISGDLLLVADQLGERRYRRVAWAP